MWFKNKTFWSLIAMEALSVGYLVYTFGEARYRAGRVDAAREIYGKAVELGKELGIDIEEEKIKKIRSTFHIVK